MKLAVCIIVLLTIATFTNAETFFAAKKRRQGTLELSPKELIANLKKTDFGKTVLNLVSLQFRTSGKLDDVVNLLISLKSKIAAQQSDEDQSYVDKTNSNNAIIESQQQAADTASAAIANDEDQLANANNYLNQALSSQASLQTQKAQIEQAIDTANGIREANSAAYAVRSKNSEALKDGLQQTLSLFQSSENALGAANSDKADEIASLLSSLIDAFAVSIAQDDQQEAQDKQDYDDYIAAQNANLANVEDQLDQVAVEIVGLNATIDSLTTAIEAQTVIRDGALKAVADTQAAQAVLDQNYNSNKSTRASQLSLLEQAQQALNSNPNDVQGYLNQA